MNHLEKSEIKTWLQKVFPPEEADPAILCLDVEALGLGEDLLESSVFLFELSQVNSLAAFTLWNRGFQQRMQAWTKEHLPDLTLSEFSCAPFSLFPLLQETPNTLYFELGRVSILSLEEVKSLRVARPVAFREIPWSSLKLTDRHHSYDEAALKNFLRKELIGIAALVAGLKRSVFNKAISYSKSRVQGDRPIHKWSEVQKLLSRLYVIVERDEKHVAMPSVIAAMDVLSEADKFVNSALQVFGGAGYTEDFKAEKSFRECVFLKNWLLPLKEAQIHLFVSEVFGYEHS